MRSIGSKIKYYREQHNLTQKDLADNVSLSELIIKDIESDEIKPDIAVLTSIANVLGVNLYALVNNRDYAFEDLCIILKENKGRDCVRRVSVIEQWKGYNVFCVTGLGNAPKNNWYINTIYGDVRYYWEVNGDIHYGASFRDAVYEFSDILDTSSDKPWVFIVDGASAKDIEGMELLISLFTREKFKVVFVVSKKLSVINIKNIFTKGCKDKVVAAYKEYDPVFNECIVDLAKDLANDERELSCVRNKESFIRELLAEPDVYAAINSVIRIAIKNKIKTI